jgi:GMP synthase-like glutamine amidotransferase
MNIGILECGPTRPELAAEFGTSPEWFKRYFGETKQRSGNFTFTVYQAYLGHIPADPHACDGWLLTGSAYSVTQQDEWMLRLQAFVCNAAKTRKVVGVCFGHQLIAKAFGGEVGAAKQGWQVGAQRYEVHCQKDWMTPQLEGFALVASHQDQVTRVPNGAEVLAGNEHCPVGMMQIGDNVMTIQLHPEMQVACSDKLIDLRANILGDARAAAAKTSLEQDIHADRFGRWMNAFLLQRD